MRQDMIQQGDVLIKRVASIPREAKKIDHGILAEGEASGHHHRIKSAITAVLFMKGLEMYMEVLKGKEAIIGHEEHKPVIVPEGCYLVEKVQEWDPFGQEARAVAD